MIDGHEIADLEANLTAAATDLQRRTAAVAEAKQVLKFAQSMEKSLLAKYMVPYILAKKSAAAAKVLAMADEGYVREFKELRDVFQRAQKHLEDYEVANTKWESARSLLSMAKAQIQPAFHQQRTQT